MSERNEGRKKDKYRNSNFIKYFGAAFSNSSENSVFIFILSFVTAVDAVSLNKTTYGAFERICPATFSAYKSKLLQNYKIYILNQCTSLTYARGVTTSQ
jgi:hypothetical protein